MIDIVWVLFCALLVFLMQAGFTCLEAGLTRTKNNINVAIKNLTDIGFTIFFFWAFGFALMFGSSHGGWVGTEGFFFPSDQGSWFATFFLFEAMFCATAATILSGATAERMRFKGYIVMSVLTAALIYPIFGHWAWNSALFGSQMGWLKVNGFVDFAGSTVVHSLGGWIALAALLIIGPRKGRFPPGGGRQRIQGSNLPMSVLGVFLMWMGWFGFNGGSTLAMDNQVAGIVVNTTLAGAAGCLSALAIGWLLKRLPDVILPINGSIAGLVAITASCHAVGAVSAVVIGAIGGMVMLGMTDILERFQIDDAVGAIPVHLGAGIWGTLAVAVFGKPESLGTGLNAGAQLWAQAAGIGVCFFWAFGLAFLLFSILNRVIPLRVTAEEEDIGLNVSEHGATTEILDMYSFMDIQAKTGDMKLRIPVEPFTEVGQIAKHYNQVLDRVSYEIAIQKATQGALQSKTKEMESFIYSISHDLKVPLITIQGMVGLLKEEMDDKMSREARTSLFHISNSALMMDQLLKDLLQVSRVGRVDVEPETVNMNELIEQVVTEVRTTVRDQEIEFRIQPNIPDGKINRTRLYQIFENLVENAAKFIPKTVENPVIEIGVSATNCGFMECYVKDNGSGIDLKRHKEKIFVLFGCLHGRDVRGTGMGLTFVKKIVESTGGSIRVESAPGKGASFYFTVPTVKEGK